MINQLVTTRFVVAAGKVIVSKEQIKTRFK